MRLFPSAAVAAPVVAGLFLLAAVVISERTSAGWFEQPSPNLNLAEAAGAARAARLLTLIREGADPNRLYEVRRGIAGNDQAVMLTPLEAAVIGGELPIVELLEANGARRDEELTARLLSLAVSRGAEEVVEHLEDQ